MAQVAMPTRHMLIAELTHAENLVAVSIAAPPRTVRPYRCRGLMYVCRKRACAHVHCIAFSVCTHAVHAAGAWDSPRNELDKVKEVCNTALRLVSVCTGSAVVMRTCGLQAFAQLHCPTS